MAFPALFSLRQRSVDTGFLLPTKDGQLHFSQGPFRVGLFRTVSIWSVMLSDEEFRTVTSRREHDVPCKKDEEDERESEGIRDGILCANSPEKQCHVSMVYRRSLCFWTGEDAWFVSAGIVTPHIATTSPMYCGKNRQGERQSSTL